MNQSRMMRPGGVRVVVASPSELPELMAIAEAAGSAAQWTRQQWQDIFRTEIPRRLSWVAWAAGETAGDIEAGAVQGSANRPVAGGATHTAKVAGGEAAGSTSVGFLVAQCGGREWELENVAVVGGFRRRGVGRALLQALLDAARAEGAERILLEVRASNLAAIGLYGRAGFAELGRRPGYYRNPPEDALIMVLVF